MDISALSEDQAKFTRYLYRHRDKVCSFQDLLWTLWSPTHDPARKQDRQLVSKMVGRIRDILGADVIRGFGKRGYKWTGEVITDDPGNGIKGQGVYERVLSSERCLDGEATFCRMQVAEGDKFILQLVQTKGVRAQNVNLNEIEWDCLINFVRESKLSTQC